MIGTARVGEGHAADYRAIAADGTWLAHRYDPGVDAVRLVRLSREDRARATFVTDEYLPPDRPTVTLHRKPLMACAPAPAPLHFILHSAFCCSTLLARALDVPGVATSLKEPVLLNDVVGCRRQGMAPGRLAGLLGDAMQLLARPLQSGERVVVKPSNIVNGLAPAILAMNRDARALLLHAPMRVFLASVARKGMWGRLWTRELFAGLLGDGLVDLGFDPAEHLRQTDLQVAALAWLAQHAMFVRLVERFGAARIRTLDSERMLARPGEALAEVAALFQLEIDVPGILAGPAFATDSKTGARFGANDRARDREAAEALHGDEIEKVSQWAAAVAAGAGVPIDLPAPLLA